MNNIGTQMIETERLVLRKFVIEDAPDAFNNWYSDFEVVMWLQNNVHTDISQTKDYLTWFISSYEKLDFYRWAITLKNENIVIGSIGFTISSERDSVADLSYSLCKRFWNQGIITESLKPDFHLIFPNRTTSIEVIYYSLFQPDYLIISC